MLWSFKYNGNGPHGYHNKNKAVKGLRYKNMNTYRSCPSNSTPHSVTGGISFTIYT